ncbi:Acetyltransferase (GNAT) family protein [Asanoa ishikariensis]|uniref:Acetyltransferase (GNAT) family protein n=1 Tax=Asanoa ishikariensis TaxID=137265 RepID=A0A1H3UU46_9ACTN|nr:GNAT family N-acetyltransferase [Asanoa ishikariensis]SDZ65970.1 Acetyltransferase (GNAT) family protein [Asanoa ishikariensis]
MSIEVTPVGPDDGQHAYEIQAQSHAFDVPDFPPLCPRSFFGSLTDPWPGAHKVHALARLDGVPAGFLELRLPYLENTGTADLSLDVLPSMRRRGVGSALLAHAMEASRADGRKHLIGESVWALPGGADRPVDGGVFARATGAALALTDIRRRLDATSIDEAALDSLVSAAWPSAAGYSLVKWAGATPEEFAADQAYLEGRLMSDAPTGDLAVEGMKMDTARLREVETARERRGRRAYTTAARHDASGRLVAITAIEFNDTPDWHAFQQITLVDPDHRGHRLGVLVKVENLRAVLAAEPALRAIDTWNAAVNAHMVAINEAIGFRPVDEWHSWQIAL